MMPVVGLRVGAEQKGSTRLPVELCACGRVPNNVTFNWVYVRKISDDGEIVESVRYKLTETSVATDASKLLILKLYENALGIAFDELSRTILDV